MSIIKFANGERHECSLCVTHDGSAYVALVDVDFAQAAAIFSDTSKTTEMEYGVYRLVGYTTLMSLSVQQYGIQAAITGGHDERIS